jgi:hypothetical protein
MLVFVVTLEIELSMGPTLAEHAPSPSSVELAYFSHNFDVIKNDTDNC